MSRCTAGTRHQRELDGHMSLSHGYKLVSGRVVRARIRGRRGGFVWGALKRRGLVAINDVSLAVDPMHADWDAFGRSVAPKAPEECAVFSHG
jgi:hypothetical protein